MRLANPPLVHVLAQVVFSPVTLDQERIRDYRTKLTDAAFPWLQDGQVVRVTVAEGAQPRIEARPRWDFLSPNRRTGIALTDNSLVLHTTEYETAEAFRDTLGRATKALFEIAGVQFVQRLGLRYIDLIRPAAGQSFEHYVDRGLLGFSFSKAPDLGASLQSLRTEATAITTAGVLVVRSMILPARQQVPPDLFPSVLAYPPETATDKPTFAMDFDHFAEFVDPFPFDPEEIKSYMAKLRNAVHAAFEVAGTPHAWEAWGPWVE